MMIKRALKHLSRVNDVLFRRTRIEREITVFPDDVFLTSYPRSGNTWCRFLVGNLAYPDDPMTFLNLEQRIPDMYTHSDRTMRNLPRPRIIKSHECFDPRYKRIVYIVRDPRDVAVSNYHVSGWLATREGHSGFLVIRYEDLQANPAPELAKVAKLLGIEPTAHRLAEAVELSSADRMRELEKNQAGKWVQTKYTRQDKPFVRKASSGNWQSVLPRESAALIEQTWGHLMTRLGYELTDHNAEQPMISTASS